MTQGAQPAVYLDYRQLLDHPGLDAVVIATPDHQHAWMAALACAAGKSIYMEVPTTHTLEEGEQLARMLRNSTVTVQTGLQHRSGAHYLSAMELLHSGGLRRGSLRQGLGLSAASKVEAVPHGRGI
ncbi:MAG: Gfo/Idh/MocA family oxidoreductase [Planctomycetaceae bacterium]